MLKDVLFLTKNIFDEALPRKKNLYKPKTVYNTYQSIKEVINSVKVLSNHYLALDFIEPCLQNSSCGEPVDKWREVFNRDLKVLNESVKNYLLNLSKLSHRTYKFESYIELEFYIEKVYHSMLYESFIKSSYNVGFIDSDSCLLKIDCLNINPKHPRKIDILEQKKIDLLTFESRVNLKNELNKINEELKIELQKLKNYLLKRYTMKDLL